MTLSQEQKLQLSVSIASVILTMIIAGGSIAYASGVTSNRVKSLEEQVQAQKEQLNEALGDLRLTVNRIDDRTRETDKAISRLEGRLTK